MRTIATIISAGLLAAASVSVSAAAPATAQGNGYYHPYYYGYAPYGYAPYGYGVPVQPPAPLTDAQRKALQEQQKKAFEYVQNVQQQMAKYYAAHPDPFYTMQRRIFEQQAADMREMNKMMRESQQDINRDMRDSMSAYPNPGFEPFPGEDTASVKEMDKQAQEDFKAAQKRHAEFLKAAEQRRINAERRFRAFRMEHGYPAFAPEAPAEEVPAPHAATSDANKS